MKKILVFLFVTLSSALLLFGCGKKQQEEEAAAPVVEQEQVIDDKPETEPKEEVEEEEVEEDLPPEEGMVRSRITNEWLTEDVNDRRPIAFMTPNTITGSHYGLSNADVLYECNV